MSSNTITASSHGAQVTPNGVTYRVWAPDENSMAAVVERDGVTREIRLTRDEEGFWYGDDTEGRAGDRYRFKFSDGRHLPDPASRFQPEGVHGPSECMDPRSYFWRAPLWERPKWKGQSIYELHLGTFSREGTYRGAIEHLAHVKELGVEAIELMPVADFSGDRNWGYDGVALYAPARCYGRPDDLRALVDAAHALGLIVILDVVYNHFGPVGNYLPQYCRDYLHNDKTTPWGQALNMDGPRNGPVRAFLAENAACWLDDFRIDGLRVDATHAIHDLSPRHILDEISEAVRARGGFLIAEDERNTSQILQAPDGSGFHFNAAWSDDFHHQVRVALTGVRNSYFISYGGSAADLAETLTHGWAYRGQPFPFWTDRVRGTPCDHLPPSAFVVCIENHDQVGNRANGERLEHLVSPAQFRAASMLLCLSPYAPMIFMGQEWSAHSPFLFFTNHGGEVGQQITTGRRREFEHIGFNEAAAEMPDPESPATFEASKLRWEECALGPHAATLALYRECLKRRREQLGDVVQDRTKWRVKAVGEFVTIRYFLGETEGMLLVALRSAVLPTDHSDLHPPAGKIWQVDLHSEEKRFGGGRDGNPGEWRLEGPGAVWLKAVGEDQRHATA